LIGFARRRRAASRDITDNLFLLIFLAARRPAQPRHLQQTAGFVLLKNDRLRMLNAEAAPESR